MEEVECQNYELCQNMIPVDCQYWGGLCMGCGSWFKFGCGWDKLTFIDTVDENRQCAICLNDNNRKLLFPANCGHSFCVSCSREILFFDEARYHLSPVPYGCPVCPNGCINPVRGIQCTCEEYDSVQELWELSNPIEYTQYNNAENISIENTYSDSAYGKKTCPLCRTKYIRKY